MEMIEEMQRNNALHQNNQPDYQEEKNIEEPSQQVIEPMGRDEEAIPQQAQLRVNAFFIELFICSLLLWGVLFIRESVYGKQLMLTIDHLLNQQVTIAPIETLISEIEVAVKQIL